MAEKDKIGTPKEVPGNTVQSQKNFDAYTMKVGAAWLDIVGAIERLRRDGTEVHRVTLKGRWQDRDELLVVIAAEGPDGPIVAFHKAPDLEGLWRGVANRIRNGSLKWREDEYAK